MFLGCGADTGGEFIGDVREGVGEGGVLAVGDGELLGGELEERVDGPLPPACEAGVVHGDFASRVEDVPGLDLERDRGVDGGEVELESVWVGDVSVLGCEWVREMRGGTHRVDAEAMF